MDFKKEFFKYFQYWPWFVLSLFLFVGAAFFYVKTISASYQTSALIFIDKKQSNKPTILPSSSSKEVDDESNLEDEIKLITSNDFLRKVVHSTNLCISYFEIIDKINSDNFVNEVPFVIVPTVSNDLLPQNSYRIQVNTSGFTVIDENSQKSFAVKGYDGDETSTRLPFKIKLSEKVKKNPFLYFENEYLIKLEPTGIALQNLKSSLEVLSDENSKGTIELNHIGISPERSRKILGDIIVLLDKNIVINQQKSYTSTVAYLNERIEKFSKDKDSIESAKEKYLQNNDILVLDNYVAEKTANKSIKSENSLITQKQITLTKFAINDIKNSDSSKVLGTDYNLEAPTVNQMLTNYNAKLLESELLLQRAGKNNPAYSSLQTQLRIQKQEILNTLEGYLNFLKQTNRSNVAEESIANSYAKSIPTKDKILGNINSKIDLKEQTYIALLQKREEAILNGAILESNLETLSSPETNYSAIYPKPKVFLLGAFLIGLLIPFGVFYLLLQFNNKVHNEEDIIKTNPNTPFLGYIPTITNDQKLDNSATSRSLIAEATRSICSNISYLLPSKKANEANVILFCSSFQGEGKSFCSFHNAITISNHNKKVLLIGADLRNPQLHEYFNVDKKSEGLTNYLSDTNEDWKGFLTKATNFSSNLDVLFSGGIPLNPTQLLTNSNLELLIEEAKELYDYIILDSAPIQMISDTLNFSHLADVTVFVTKFDYTEMSSLVKLNTFIKKNQLKNVGILINGVNSKSSYGYNYGINYGYQYEEKKEKKVKIVKLSWLKKKAFYVLLFVITVIFYLSWLPDPSLKEVTYLPKWILKWSNENYNLRTTIPFLAVGYLLEVLTTQINFKEGSVHRNFNLLQNLGIATLIVGIAEGGQFLIQKRSPDLMDVFYGIIGSILGSLIFILLSRFKKVKDAE
jgi:capsular exopolysaccharide synthesis family protein